MSRGEIAHYPRLAAGPVSRVLTRFRTRKLITIEGRELELLEPTGLRQIGLVLVPD